MRSLIKSSSAPPPCKSPSLNLFKSMVPTLRRQHLQLTSSGLVMALALKCAHFEMWLRIILPTKKKPFLFPLDLQCQPSPFPRLPYLNRMVSSWGTGPPGLEVGVDSRVLTFVDWYQPIDSPWYNTVFRMRC